MLLGDSAVGKTSLIRRYVIDMFHDHYIETIGTKVSKKDIELEIDGKEFSLSLQIWDVLGQKAYSSVQSRAFVGMDGALLVADITRKETLDSIESYWLPTLKKVVDDAQLVFLANKNDLKDGAQFTLDDIGKISSKHTFLDINNFFLTSAKTGENVDEAFLTLARMTLLHKKFEDPTRELFEELMAESVYMESDRASLVGVADVIITDFCIGYGDEEKGMEVLREHFLKAGVDVSNPTKEGLLKLIENIAEEGSKFMSEEIAKERKEKWLRMVKDAKEGG